MRGAGALGHGIGEVAGCEILLNARPAHIRRFASLFPGLYPRRHSHILVATMERVKDGNPLAALDEET